MESENPFKNVQLVSAADPKYSPNELIFLSDDEEEPKVATIQIELRETNREMNTPPYDSDNNNDSPLSIKIEPEQIRDMNNLESPEIFRSCKFEDELSFMPNISFLDDGSNPQDEEQFQIIESEVKVKAETEEKEQKTNEDDSKHLNIKHNQSTESVTSFHDDHSYSQSQNPLETTICDEMIHDILKKADAKNDRKAVEMLRNYTECMKQYVLTEDDPNSQVSLYLTQMDAALSKFNIDKPISETSNDPQVSGNLLQITTAVEKVPLNGTHQSTEIKMEVGQSEEMLTSEIQIKQELALTQQHPATNGIDESVIENAEIIKVYAKRAQELNARFTENNQKLIESVYVSQDDIDNGRNKLITSLKNLMSANLNLLMDFEGKDEEAEDAEIERLRQKILKTSRKRERYDFNTSDDDDGDGDDDDSDSDDSVEKLINFNSLGTKNRKNKEQDDDDDKPIAEMKKDKKKEKENKAVSDSSTSDSDDDMDSICNNASDNESDDGRPNLSDEDEEEKMKRKIEDEAREALLKSSDDESEDYSYKTSSTSSFEFSDDEKMEKPKLKKDSLKTDELKEPQNKYETVDEELPAPKANQDDEIQDEKTDNSDDEDKIEQNPKKKQRKTSVDKILNKKFTQSDSESDDDRVPTSRTVKSTNKDNSAKAIDLSVTAKPKVDLEKYFEKRANQSVAENVNVEASTSKALNIESPQKAQVEANSKAAIPSPASLSIDDIDCISISSESDSEISSTNAEGKTRRRKQLTEEELKEETKKAKKEEQERIKRLEVKHSRLSQFMTERLSQNDVIEANELILDHSEEKNLEISVHPQLVDRLKEHQKDGIKFMYNNCFGSVDEVKQNNGSGCILAHCMGLGKTLQLIALVQTAIRYPELHTKKILVICPKSTIYNWNEEFKNWLRNVGDNRPTVKFLEENSKIEQKLQILEEWYESKKPSVFLINYESFRILVNWSGTNKRNKTALSEDVVKKYQMLITKYLLDPGPHLVVCDEGHIIKNQKGATNKAVTKIKTKRRIILTGTPVQNALHEYYAMVQWIKPNYLGTITEFNNMYANPIKDGQNKDSTPQEIKKMKFKSYVLNKNLSTFVQRKDASILREFLPNKHEYCVFIPLTAIQEMLYNHFLNENRTDQMGKQLLPTYTALRKIWTHPKVLQYAYERALKNKASNANNAALQIQQQQQQQQQQQKKNNTKSKNTFEEDGEGEEPDDVFDTSQGSTAVTKNWWSTMISNDELESLNTSHKIRIVFEILKLVEENREKVLIFSSFVAVLDVIEQFMKSIHNQDRNQRSSMYGFERFKIKTPGWGWELGKDYYRIDGSTPKNVRQEMINGFNKSGNPRLRCFLISSKAGGQGINLIAANRCIIVDTSWNPSNDLQNIFRIYRLGQTKTCYIYRLVAAGTMEEKVYSRSVTKEAMSHRVVEKKQIDRHYVKDELNELFVPYALKPRGKPNFPQDQLLQYLLHYVPDSAYGFHEHDSLLENKPEEDLNEEEKKEAWNSYEEETRSASRFVNALQNNMNLNLQANLFGKPGDYAKYYQEIQSLYNSWNLGGGGILPSSTSVLDPNSLASTYYPPSHLYTNEFFKRIGSYDPLNLYSSGTSLSSLASLTSPSSSSITNSSSLVSSLLRNSPHNPISALGNMTATATTTTAAISIGNSNNPTTSYNANNIPPASNSIFAQPSTSGNQVVASIVPASGTSLLTNKDQKLPFTTKSAIVANRKQLKAQNHKLMARKLTTINNNPLVVPPNSSENVSILPDESSSSSSSLRLSISKTNNGTMATTTSPRLQKSTSNTSLNLSSNNGTTAARTNYVVKKVNPSFSNSNIKTTVVNRLQNVIQPISTKNTNVNNNNTAIPRKNLSTDKELTPNNQQRYKQLPKRSNPLTVRKNSPIGSSSAASSKSIQDNRKQLNPVSPSKAILNQLEKNHTSLIDNTRKSSNSQQRQSQILNSPTQNSVSIIKLASKNSSSPGRTTSLNSAVPRVISAQNSPTITAIRAIPRATIQNSPLTARPIASQILNSSQQQQQQRLPGKLPNRNDATLRDYPRLISQQVKRASEETTAQALKKIKLTPQSYNTNNQPFRLQNVTQRQLQPHKEVEIINIEEAKRNTIELE